MQTLYLDRKTGFRNNDLKVPIIIRDLKGRMFYETESFNRVGKPVKTFNLPVGAYKIVCGNFSKMNSPVQYPLMTLPPKQRCKQNPSNFKIVIGHNPNKCSIIWDLGIILYDRTLYETASVPTIFFIYGHEKGHRFYSTEKYCDWYSSNYMLRMGFNPSQIGLSPIESLSRGQAERKKQMVNNLIRL